MKRYRQNTNPPLDGKPLPGSLAAVEDDERPQTFAADIFVPLLQNIIGGGAGALGAATVYLRPPGVVATSTEYQLARATRGGAVRNLYCKLGTAPGGADTVIVTVRRDASDLAVTCTISGASTTCSDSATIVSVLAAENLSIKAVSSAGTAADLTCSVEVTN